MSPAVEVALVAQREMRKNLRSAKGIALVALSLLGGVVVALALAWIDKKQREELASLPPEALAQVREKIALQLGGGDEDFGKMLAEAPGALIGILKMTVWLGPALIALLGFDAISGEVQQRTVRYWTVRTRRASYYVGKVLGLWTVVSSVTLFMHVLVWIVMIARGEPTGATLSWGIRFWLVSLPISLVWCAIAQLVGSQLRQPILALLMILACFFVMWIAYVVGLTGHAPWIVYVYPNYYDAWLLHPHFDRVMEGLGICFGSAALYVTAGALAFGQRDV